MSRLQTVEQQGGGRHVTMQSAFARARWDLEFVEFQLPMHQYHRLSFVEFLV